MKKIETVISCYIDPKHIEGDDYKHLSYYWFPFYFNKGRISIEEKLGIDMSVVRCPSQM